MCSGNSAAMAHLKVCLSQREERCSSNRAAMSVLQCVAVCCSVLQCVAVCSSNSAAMAHLKVCLSQREERQGLRLKGLWFLVYGSVFMVSGSTERERRCKGLGFRLQASGFRVHGSWFRV